jgi:AcrR family transcriptional regulator
LSQVVARVRKSPRQRRAREKVELILEAAVQLLESAGIEGFNTNAIAERAGVSIGSLYRYFPDKSAILQALADREVEAHQRVVARLLKGETAGMAEDRALIRAFLHAFKGKTRARRIAMQAWFANAQLEPTRSAGLEPAYVDADGAALSPIAAFVLSRAIQGAMRAAVLEGADFLLSQQFEDELVRLGRAYRGFPVRPQPSTRATAGTALDALPTPIGRQ